jgi:hypothetical protein
MFRQSLLLVSRLAVDVASIVLSAVFLGWGVWLLLTPEPGSDRHKAGVALVTVGAVAGVWSAFGAWRRLRRRRASRAG